MDNCKHDLKSILDELIKQCGEYNYPLNQHTPREMEAFKQGKLIAFKVVRSLILVKNTEWHDDWF